MADLKTRPTKASVAAFLTSIPDAQVRKDARAIAAMMRKVTGMRAVMWGPSIVGFDTYHFKYASGREGDWPIVGFSPRKQNLTLYIMPGFGGYAALMKKLGKHTTGSSCLYFKTLSDVDMPTLTELVTRAVAHMRTKHHRK